MTTLEDVKRCPKCDQPGAPTGSTRRTDRSTIHVVECRNQRCRWFNERWLYQVRPDGTLVEPDNKRRQKLYPTIPSVNEQQYLANLDEEIKRSMGNKP